MVSARLKWQCVPLAPDSGHVAGLPHRPGEEGSNVNVQLQSRLRSDTINWRHVCATIVALARTVTLVHTTHQHAICAIFAKDPSATWQWECRPQCVWRPDTPLSKGGCPHAQRYSLGRISCSIGLVLNVEPGFTHFLHWSVYQQSPSAENLGLILAHLITRLTKKSRFTEVSLMLSESFGLTFIQSPIINGLVESRACTS